VREGTAKVDLDEAFQPGNGKKSDTEISVGQEKAKSVPHDSGRQHRREHHVSSESRCAEASISWL